MTATREIRGVVPVPVPRFCARYSASPSSVGVIRGEVEAVARELGIEGEQLGDVTLAVSEAAANAVVNGPAGRHDDLPVRVRVDVADLEMLVTISGRTEVCLAFGCPARAKQVGGGAYVRLQRAGEQVAARQA